jgi:hypothetical protein
VVENNYRAARDFRKIKRDADADKRRRDRLGAPFSFVPRM